MKRRTPKNPFWNSELGTFDAVPYAKDFQHTMRDVDKIQKNLEYAELRLFPCDEETTTRFWNEYAYPKIEKIYKDLFPEPETKNKCHAWANVDQKLIIATSRFVAEYGLFHEFDGRLCVIKYYFDTNTYLLESGLPIYHFSPYSLGKAIDELIIRRKRTADRRTKIKSELRDILIVVFVFISIVIFNILFGGPL